MTDVNFGDAGGIITEELKDDVRESLVGRERNLIAQTVQRANENLEGFSGENEWEIENIKQSVNVETNETKTGFAIRIYYEHEAADFFEFGTSEHTISGDPLSFVWEERHNPPGWVSDEFDSATSERGRPGYRVYFREVEVAGIPETRFLRDALRFFERQMKGTQEL